jgi:hypothetical protein
MSGNDDKIIEWKRSMLPNLMRSEVGKWMLDSNLTEYYSEEMIKDLREAAGEKDPSAPPVESQTAKDRKPGG